MSSFFAGVVVPAVLLLLLVHFSSTARGEPRPRVLLQRGGIVVGPDEVRVRAEPDDVVVGLHSIRASGRTLRWDEVLSAERHGDSVWLRTRYGDLYEICPASVEALEGLHVACREALARAASLSPRDPDAEAAVARLTRR